jgi:phosphoenolpyruvate carboxylase
MSRKTDFPKVMCTQHPDSASKYIATQEEPGEAIEAALVFGCDEYMPDYEGKATPYHQNVQIVSKLVEETDLVPGKDFFYHSQGSECSTGKPVQAAHGYDVNC